MSKGLDVCFKGVEMFVEYIYNPLFEYFGLGTFVILFFPIYFSLRFLLRPLISGRALEMGSDSAKPQRISTSTELRVQ